MHVFQAFKTAIIHSGVRCEIDKANIFLTLADTPYTGLRFKEQLVFMIGVITLCMTGSAPTVEAIVRDCRNMGEEFSNPGLKKLPCYI